MNLVHLTASTFFGGPERQMLGLARALPADCRTRFLSFSEHGRCRAFLEECRDAGFTAAELPHDTPHFRSVLRDLTTDLRYHHARVLFCHGYKANLLGRLAARHVGIPVVAVSRGWTAESRKVRLYEWLDRRHLRFMDRVVAVSHGQAEKIRQTGVAEDKLCIIRNSARLDAFLNPDPAGRAELRRLVPNATPATRIVLAAGRLSPEKGFHVLIDAIRLLKDNRPQTVCLLFGEGKERADLERRIIAAGLTDQCFLPGFRNDLDRLLPWADAFVLPSFTEGLPNVVLEASAAAVPVVATAVGGTPELIDDRTTGLLVPPGDPHRLADALRTLLTDEATARQLGEAARAKMEREFTFHAQAEAYLRLCDGLCPTNSLRDALEMSAC